MPVLRPDYPSVTLLRAMSLVSARRARVTKTGQIYFINFEF